MITGTMGNYLKNIGLQQKWQKRKDDLYLTASSKVVTQTAASQKDDIYTAAMESFMKNQEELRGKIKSLLKENADGSRASVEFKLQYGGKLSPREMEYIRNNCPDLYAKAMEREKEREQYAAQLRNCNSTEEVFALRIGRLASLMGECRAAENRGDYGASFELRARLYNIEEEHDDYIKSDAYRELCSKEKAEKDAVAEKNREKKDAAAQEVEELVQHELHEEKNVKQRNGMSTPDEEKTPETKPHLAQEQQLSETNPNISENKIKPADNKRSRHTKKQHYEHLAENKMKFAADNYQKNNSAILIETFDVKSDAPLNSATEITGSVAVEIKGNLSINI